MGINVRNCLVLSLTSVAIVATTAWADRPAKQKCAEACNEFTAEFVGSSDRSASLNRKQRGAVVNSIRQMAKQCMKLCGFSVVDIDLLAELVATLRAAQGDGDQSGINTSGWISSGGTTAPFVPRATATPTRTPTSVATATARATASPKVTVTAAPVVTAISDPPSTNAPYPVPGIV
jgi:hypothetical protein